jgi:nucleoid-associated protein YgaU
MNIRLIHISIIVFSVLFWSQSSMSAGRKPPVVPGDSTQSPEELIDEDIPESTEQPVEEESAIADGQESDITESSAEEQETGGEAVDVTGLPGVPKPAAKGTIHKVWIWQETGDCLRSLAQKYYGDPEKWTLIYDANRDQISDPSKIYPKQELIIPEE